VFLLAFVGFASLIFVLAVYFTYFMLVYRKGVRELKNFSNIESLKNSWDTLPSVSIIVNTYNEASIIRRKLEDISSFDYPSDKLEIIVVDDCSTDETGIFAEKALFDFNLKGKVLNTPRRLGLNASLNLAFEKASYDIVCVTDSDVTLDRDALRAAVCVLECSKEAGGVTGRVQPVFGGAGVAQTSEDTYRSFYDKSMLGESSLHSAFPGNGPLIVFDKSKVPFSIPVNYGSSDGNIAMNVIKSGLRFVYLPSAVFFEQVPETVEQQKLQKIRRAKRLIQVFLHNMDMFLNNKYGNFGRIIFPLKLLMLSVCPVLLLTGLILIAVSVVLSQSLLLYAVSTLAILSVTTGLFIFRKLRNTLLSFVFHQVYLIAGLISSIRKSTYWRTINRK
jgi:cellulose synthase/poly-beta-1,6-N-acetylglucosamine synthase-like glycosyltransferase